MSALTARIPGGTATIAAAAALLILAGYGDLWIGGTTLAAILLTVGYVVLIPWSFVAAANHDPDANAVEADAPPYRAAALLGLAIFVLYVLTLAPSTAMWDTSEYMSAAKTLGIPHPPGNPVFVMVAHAFAALPIPVSFAERVNLLAATTSAISAALWMLVAHRSLAGWKLDATPRLIIAIVCAWVGATAFTVWNQSVVNEKVYTLAILGLSASAWAALRWHDAPPHSRRADAFLLLIAYLCGLGYANHPAGFLPVPAFGLFVLLRRPGTLLRWRVVLSAAAALVLGLTTFAFMPIRAAHFPGINEGAASACVTGAPQVSCTFSSETVTRVKSIIQREQYGGHPVADRQAPIGAQFGMWWLYFKWQWLRDAWQEHPAAQLALAWLFLGLGLVGGTLHFKRDRASFAFVAPLIFTLTPALVFYLNFKYGFSQDTELGDSVNREVRDRDYFFLWSFATWGIWAGMGIGALWQAIATRLSDSTPAVRRWQMASPVLLLGVLPLINNFRDASRRGQTFTAEWARDLLQSVEPYGILITAGDNDSFPVWYAQQVEGVRRDVTIALIPYLNMEWYAHELIRDRVQPYDGSGVASYAALAGPRPDKPIIALTPAQADSLPPMVQLQNPVSFQQNGINATIPAGYITRDQLMVLQMIRDAFPARPIHFSIGPYARSLGLGDYVVTQGLTQKLLPEPAKNNPAYVNSPIGYIDIARSTELWKRYGAPAALLRQGRWLDDASVSIPAAYIQTAQIIGYAYAVKGDTVRADSLASEMQRMARAAKLMK